MIKKIIKAMVEGRLLKTSTNWIKIQVFSIPRRIDKFLSRITIFILSRTIKVEDNKIFFITFRGEYDCNAKWIAEELNSRELPYTFVWTIRKKVPTEDIPDNFIKVYRGTYDFFKQLSSAKIIVDNGVSTAFLGYKRKKNQILIETWHGSLGIKMFSRETNKDKHWCNVADNEGQMTNYCISNSTFEDDIFKNTFWNTTKILQLGHARNDILCSTDTDKLNRIREKVFNYFKLEDHVRICLYAPTFRDDGDMRPYKIDYEHLKQVLELRFGGEWVILTRFHFRLLKKLKSYRFPKGVINASKYSDIQEILSCTDVGITDYSSWICDYMLTLRPGFLFATDMDEYEVKDREFFYPLDTMPFPLALNNEQLIDNILNFDDVQFVNKCKEFLKNKGCIDDGFASVRIADAIERLMAGEVL